MNPRDELLSLTNLFPSDEPLFQNADHLPSSLTPEPYKSLLAHDHHMTVAMETYHGGPVDVRVLNHRREGDIYAREIILLKGPSTMNDAERRVVQYGIVRFNFSYVTEAVRDEIESGSER